MSVNRPSTPVKGHAKRPSTDSTSSFRTGPGKKVAAAALALSPMTASPNQGRPPSLDILRFADEDFKAEKYVHGILTQSTEEGVRAFHQALVDAKDAAAADLQRNVYKNYNEFVLISKEISKLESDMLTLGSLLSELREINANLQPEGSIEKVAEDLMPANDTPSPTQALSPSSSLAKQSEEQSRSTALSNLYDAIEGLSKILPPNASRHLIRDGSQARFMELNPGNLNKVIQTVHFFLLSDTLLITTKKRGIISGKSRMVLDKCWSLADVAVIDVKDSTEVSNAFKILRHPDTYIYRSETLEEKRSFLATFKRYTDELMLQKRAAIESAKARQSAQKQIDDTPSPTQLDVDREVEKQRKPLKDDLTATDVKWLMEMADELDVLIAHRDFDVAVGLIEKARSTLSKATAETPRVTLIRTNIEDRTNKLAQLVSLDLTNPVASKSQVQANIDKLLRLGLGDQARDFFLTSRAAIVRHKIRLIRIDGDVSVYINDLAEVVFKQIRNTCEWYGGSFRDTTMASGFMKWVAIELENFTDTFRRQVFDSDQPFTTIADCLQHTMHHCAQLKEVGLHITPIISHHLHDDLVKAIEEHSRASVERIEGAVKADRFGTVDPKWLKGREDEFADITADVSHSVYELYSILMEFGADVSVLMSIRLYTRIVGCLTAFFSSYIKKLLAIFCGTGQFVYKQRSMMTVDAIFVVDDLLPKVAGQLAHRFERPIPELEDMKETLNDAITTMQDTFVTQTTEKLIKEKYNFATVDYSGNGGILDNAKPSEHIMRLTDELNTIYEALSPTLPRIALLTTVVKQLFEYMGAPNSWVTPRGNPRSFGFHGVQQLILDFHFFVRICEPLISPEVDQATNEISERALKIYMKAYGSVPALKPSSWYEQRVEDVLVLISSEFPHLLSIKNGSMHVQSQ